MITAKSILIYLISALPTFGVDVDTSGLDVEQTYCLAKNIYYESRGEGLVGQYAVASTTLNRVEDPEFPDEVCDVVKYKAVSNKTKKTVCAFSWYCEPDKKDKELVFTRPDGTVDIDRMEQFQIASIIAITTLTDAAIDPTNGATHFHNPYTSFPDWRHRMQLTVKLDNHNFYKKRKR